VTGAGTVLLAAAGAIVAVMLATWLVSLRRRDASIVDPVWPLGFVVVAWIAFVLADGVTGRRLLLALLTTVWGLRLGIYLAWRKRGHGEDFRYVAMRRRYGERFGWVSLVTVFGVQGALMWVVALPVTLGPVPDEPGLGLLAVLGALVWAGGLAFEAIGDAQLARFKADPASAGQVMDRGLWRYTRHPNYFGDACVWWGLAIIAAETTLGRWGLVGAVVMTVLLRRVSGVTLLERSLVRRRPGYLDYTARTSPFLPRPPRRV